VRRSWLVPLAILAGLAWIAGILLVSTQADSDPVGARYDAYNRVLTLAIVLLLASSVAIRRRLAAAGAPGVRAMTAVVVGLALNLAGNVLEFWGSLAAGQETEKTARRLGLEEEFWGSAVGWFVYLAGGLIVVASLVAVAVKLGRWGRISRLQRLAVGSAGVLMAASSALWAVSPVAAAVPAALTAFAWLALADVAESAGSRSPTATGEAPA
jgi:hypothetical protein